MAAVTGGLYEAQRVKLESSDETAVDQAARLQKALGSFSGLGAALRQLPTVPQSHAGLTRTVWIRRVLEQWAANQRFVVATGEEGSNAGQLVLRLKGPPMPKSVVPWMTAVRETQEFALWGESGKMSCVAHDTPVLTVRGVVPIQQVVAGDSVMTRAGWRPVLASQRTGERATLKLVAETGQEIRVTPDHLVLSKKAWAAGEKPSPSRRGEPEWLRAGELTTEHFVYPTPEGFEAPLPPGSPDDFDRGLLLGYVCGDGTFAANGRIAIDVGEAKWMDLDTLAAAARRLFSAEPHWGEYQSQRGASDESIIDPETPSSLMRRLYWEHGAVTVFFASHGFKHGVKSPLRRIPAQVLAGTLATVRGFLSGLLSTDGSVQCSREGRTTAEFSTTSSGLALDIQQLFALLGARVSVSIHRDLHRVQVTSRAALNVLRAAGVLNPHKAQRLGEVVPESREPGRLRGARIEAILDDGIVTPVYDLTVEEHPEFVAGGLIVHNCPTWDLPAGGLYVGGTCPGADVGQTVVAPEKRRTGLQERDGKFFLRHAPPGIEYAPEMVEGGTICSQCITGDTLIMVRGEGLRRIDEMLGRRFQVWSGIDWRETHVIEKGIKSTVTLRTRNGVELRATADHRILTSEGWVEAGHLEQGDLLPYALPAEMPFSKSASTGLHEVDEVIPSGREEMVYDLVNVGDEHQFLANGLVIHNCYAFEGNYPSPHVQLGEVLRYWWVRSMLEQRRAAELVDTLILSMKLIRYPETPYGILPVRVHSAGDFFSKEYARVWLTVADELWRMGGNASRIRMWAPTRTWAQWGNEFWNDALGNLQAVKDGAPPNLMVRASAYNFNDAAPGKFHPTNAAGSTSLMQSRDAARLERNKTTGIGASDPRAFIPPSTEQRYDWACPTYSIEQETHTCANATNPEGGVHCRACWVRPDWRVQYTAH